MPPRCWTHLGVVLLFAYPLALFGFDLLLPRYFGAPYITHFIWARPKLAAFTILYLNAVNVLLTMHFARVIG